MNTYTEINKTEGGQKPAGKFFGSNNSSVVKCFIQPRLTINNPNDAYEQEADAVADKVMRMGMPSIQTKPIAISSLQRKCEHCEEEEKKMQRKDMNGQEATAGSGLENYVGNINGSGQSLPGEVRNFYEPRFGYDFSNVKVHTDSVAAKSAQSINALAYTSGNNIVFNNGQYSPNTDNGKRLLGHELTHVVQQNSMQSTVNRKIQRRLIVSGSSEALVNEYLGVVGAASGLRLNWTFATPRVTNAGNLAGPVPSPQGRANITRVINHATQHAELHIGRNQPNILMGGFPTGGSTIQTIDMDDIRSMNASLPGQGTALAFHEMMENFNAHAVGFAVFGPPHTVGSEVESDVLEDLGIAGRRLSTGIVPVTIPAPPGLPTGPNITYFRFNQAFTHYFLEVTARQTTGSPTGPGADLEIISSRRIPKVQVSQRTIDSFISNSNAIPAAGNVTLVTALADLNGNPNSSILIEGFADSAGSAQANATISRNRAESARAFFIANGIAAGRIAIVGRGETNFVATNANEAGRALNRRIVLTVHRP